MVKLKSLVFAWKINRINQQNMLTYVCEGADLYTNKMLLGCCLKNNFN